MFTHALRNSLLTYRQKEEFILIFQILSSYFILVYFRHSEISPFSHSSCCVLCYCTVDCGLVHRKRKWRHWWTQRPLSDWYYFVQGLWLFNTFSFFESKQLFAYQQSETFLSTNSTASFLLNAFSSHAVIKNTVVFHICLEKKIQKKFVYVYGVIMSTYINIVENTF